MRLLNAHTRKLEEYTGRNVPRYAILSHRWEEEEVIFQDMTSPTSLAKKGYEKIKSACWLTLDHGLDYLWVDTCCIDKGSSSELGEAINSMYSWYAEAEICFVYLADVRLPGHPIKDSAWVSRGWTLQELIAPRRMSFYDTDWNFLGTKKDLTDTLADATGIDLDVLTSRSRPSSCSIAQRMSWAAHRVTERTEDRAYSLLGLFDVNIPMLYGEGEKAFLRLQEEIVKYSDDQSIFAWDRGFENHDGGRCGMLATSPSQFAKCQSVTLSQTTLAGSPFSLTNIGLSIRMLTIPWTMETFLAILDCSLVGRPKDRLGIFLEQLSTGSNEQHFARVKVKAVTVMVIPSLHLHKMEHGLVRQLHIRQTVMYPSANLWYGFHLRMLNLPGYTKQQLSRAKIYTRKVDGRLSIEEIPYLSIPDGRCGTVAVWRMPPSVRSDNLITWMQFGFDGDFVPVCRFGGESSAVGSPNLDSWFKNKWTIGSASSRLKTTWRDQGNLLFRVNKTGGLEEELRFLGTKISITRCQPSKSAFSETPSNAHKQVWTIDIEAMEVTKELQRERQRNKVYKALKVGGEFLFAVGSH